MKLALPGVLYDVPRKMPILTVPLKGNSSIRDGKYIAILIGYNVFQHLYVAMLTSRNISYQSINGRGRRAGNRFVIHALKSSIHFICQEVSETVDLALELYSKNVITSEQLDPMIESLGKKGQRKIQNYKLLRIVEANVSKDPLKFHDLCDAFEELNLHCCSQNLKGTLYIEESMQLVKTAK